CAFRIASSRVWPYVSTPGSSGTSAIHRPSVSCSVSTSYMMLFYPAVPWMPLNLRGMSVFEKRVLSLSDWLRRIPRDDAARRNVLCHDTPRPDDRVIANVNRPQQDRPRADVDAVADLRRAA